MGVIGIKREGGPAMEKKALGYYGEQAALAYVRHEKGYHVRCCNYRNRLGEIDLIAEDGHTLVFIEVKTRRSERLATALGDVDRFKQMHLMSAAYAYLSRYNVRPAFRFDVVTIVGEQPPYHLKHYVNVFTPWGIQAWRREHHRLNRK